MTMIREPVDALLDEHAAAIAAVESRAVAAEADCKRLQDEVGNLEAAVRQADATLKLHGLVDTGGQDLLVKLNEDTMAKLIACESRALAAEAAAAAMREALEWRPIETLPEFRRAFVGRYSDHGVWEGPRYVWRQVDAHWYNWAPAGQTPYRNWSWGDRDPLYGEPTHWHPLLAPPPAPDSAAIASPTPGAALLAERDRLREALDRAFTAACQAGGGKLDSPARGVWDILRAALKETSNG